MNDQREAVGQKGGGEDLQAAGTEKYKPFKGENTQRHVKEAREAETQGRRGE